MTPYGEIPWTRLSRISDEEMKTLMIDVVDHLFTLLTNSDSLRIFSRTALEEWKQPELLEGFSRALSEKSED